MLLQAEITRNEATIKQRRRGRPGTCKRIDLTHLNVRRARQDCNPAHFCPEAVTENR
jgi:hypothetical protein